MKAIFSTPFSVLASIHAIVYSLSILICSVNGAELPSRDRPDKRISIDSRYYLWPFSSFGPVKSDLGTKLWAIADFSPKSGTDNDNSQTVLMRWAWNGDELKQGSDITFDKGARTICLLYDDSYISEIEEPLISDGPITRQYVLRDSNGALQKRWYTKSEHWRVFPSANGQYVALFSVSDSIITFDASRLKDLKCRIGLIDVVAGELTWVIESQPESIDEQFPFQGYADSAIALPTNDGKRIAIMPFEHDGKTDQLTIVDVSTHKLVSSAELIPRFAMRFSIDNSVLYVGAYAPEVVSLETKSGKILESWAATADGEPKTGVGLPKVIYIALSPDGEYAAAAINGVPGGDIYVRSLRNKKTVRLIHGSKSIVDAVAFSPDSKRLASIDHNSICIWSRQSWE
jgi:hypothetical protein